MTLQQILDYANTLTEDGFDNLADIIEFLNEAQELIARWDMVRATPMIYNLVTNEIQLPDDFLQLAKATLDDYPLAISSEPWDGVLTLPTSITSGTLKIWYYRTPEVLVSTNASQVPEVGVQYHRSMASYAAKMYYLIDDDAALREAYRNEFIASLSSMRVSSGMATNFVNY